MARQALCLPAALQCGMVLTTLATLAPAYQPMTAQAPRPQTATGAPETSRSLPIYTEEEILVFSRAARLAREASEGRAQHDYTRWAKRVRDFLDFTGSLKSNSASGLAVAYGTQFLLQLVDDVTERPSVAGARDVREVLGERLGPQWFPSLRLNERLEGTEALAKTEQRRAVDEVTRERRPAMRVRVISQYLNRCDGLGVPLGECTAFARTLLTTELGPILALHDSAAAEAILADPALRLAIRPSERHRLEQVVARAATD